MTTASGHGADDALDFSRTVPDNGYAWWYLDAIADDGEHGLTLIAFVGSVFSPHYARARRRAVTAADDYCALNLALYGGRTARWAFSEYAPSLVHRTHRQFTLGGNRLRWDGHELKVDIDERSAPLRQRLRGTITLTPQPLVSCDFALSANGRHHWRPLAPSARITVDMQHPTLRWQGRAYLDANDGAVPLAEDFHRWDWCRAHGESGTELLYHVHTRDGQRRRLALHFDIDGQCHERIAPAATRLPATRLWRIPRHTHSEDGYARVITTLEDTPFYARSLIETRLGGVTLSAVHESLSMERFSRPWVQALLPFRVRRVRR